MAKYDYCCGVCESIQEERHGMNEEPIVLCKKCKEKGNDIIMNRIISGGTGIIFKGFGFYETDYKQKK